MTTLRQAQDERNVRQFTVQHDDNGVRLDRWFKRHLPQIGFAMISRWARTGQIRVDGKRADPADRLAAGQVIRVPPGGDAPAKGGAKPRRELSEEEIARIKNRVLVAIGTNDDIAGSGERLANALPRGAFLPIPGRDHMKAVGDKQAYETKQIKSLFHGKEAKTDMEAVVKSSQVEFDRLAAALKAVVKPVDSTIKVEEVR